jgi:hypothetical protein
MLDSRRDFGPADSARQDRARTRRPSPGGRRGGMPEHCTRRTGRQRPTRHHPVAPAVGRTRWPAVPRSPPQALQAHHRKEGSAISQNLSLCPPRVTFPYPCRRQSGRGRFASFGSGLTSQSGKLENHPASKSYASHGNSFADGERNDLLRVRDEQLPPQASSMISSRSPANAGVSSFLGTIPPTAKMIRHGRSRLLDRALRRRTPAAAGPRPTWLSGTRTGYVTRTMGARRSGARSRPDRRLHPKRR